MVHGNMLIHFPITVTNIKHAQTIFGPDIGSLRGKTVRRKTETVMSDYVAIPNQIKEKMKTIELTVDVIFVNKIPFVISLGKNNKFITIKNVVDRKADTLLKALCNIKSVYKNKNIFITTLYMDNEFEVLRNALQSKGITLNTNTAD